MLDLTSPLWAGVQASAGGNGLLTAALLRQLRAGDAGAWAELHHQVCHQDTVGETAYVAAPHMVAIAQTAAARLRSLLLGTLASVVSSMELRPGDAPAVRGEWKAEFERACADACRLAAESLHTRPLDRDDSLQFIRVLAAMHGHSNLATLLDQGPDVPCPHCGAYLGLAQEGE